MIAQIAGCREEDDQVTPFVPDEDAQFWSVYIGGPGWYKCLRDFEHKMDALIYAEQLVKDGRAHSVDDRTFSKGDYHA